MFGLSRGRSVVGDEYPGTLAGEHSHGDTAGSGMVPAGSPIHTDPDAGGRHDDLGRHAVQTTPQPATDLLPIPGVVTRQMVGGVRVAHHDRLLWETPAYDGSHVELRNRVSVVVLRPDEGMTPEVGDTLPSLRVPPPSDPYGRACANARAAAAR